MRIVHHLAPTIHLAGGGFLPAGRVAMVGEHGPEPVVFDQDARVYPTGTRFAQPRGLTVIAERIDRLCDLLTAQNAQPEPVTDSRLAEQIHFHEVASKPYEILEALDWYDRIRGL